MHKRAGPQSCVDEIVSTPVSRRCTGASTFANEAQALKRGEKPLDRVQQEALAVSDRLTLLAKASTVTDSASAARRRCQLQRFYCKRADKFERSPGLE